MQHLHGVHYVSYVMGSLQDPVKLFYNLCPEMLLHTLSKDTLYIQIFMPHAIYNIFSHLFMIKIFKCNCKQNSEIHQLMLQILL